MLRPPQDVWSAVEAEVSGGRAARLAAWAFVALKRASGRVPRALRPALLPPLRAASGALGAHLSRAMLVACECAVELAMALGWAPPALWLREAPQATAVREEMAREARRVTRFIIDREMEAPQRFRAIQSYRAAMALLRQQERFVDQLFTAGVLDGGERERMLEPGEREQKMRGCLLAPVGCRVVVCCPRVSHCFANSLHRNPHHHHHHHHPHPHPPPCPVCRCSGCPHPAAGAARAHLARALRAPSPPGAALPAPHPRAAVRDGPGAGRPAA